MWPDCVVGHVQNLLNAEQLQKYYYLYISEVLVPEWNAEADKLRTNVEFRDFREESLSKLYLEFDVDESSTCELFDSKDDSSKKREDSIKFLTQKARQLKFKNYSKLFLIFCIQKEVETYIHQATTVGLFRPILSCSVDIIENVVKNMESKRLSLTLDDFLSYAKQVGVSSILPILALYCANEKGDVEMFLHPPMPKIFGAASTRDILKTHKPTELLAQTILQKQIEKRQRPFNPLHFQNLAVAGSGFLGYYDDKHEFIITKYSRACMIAPLPNISKCVWALNPETNQGAILRTFPFKIFVEFDLPITDEPTNWIDCQRDEEGNLVLIWGHINSLTGMLNTQNVMGFNFSTLEFSNDLFDIPKRNVIGTKLDWRDHGNLLNVHCSVQEEEIDSKRKWKHCYEICFGSYLLMTMMTDSRPIEAVYGSPREIFLLSPLSSTQTLQYWCHNGQEYKLDKFCGIKKPDYGQWKTLCVTH